MHHEFVEPNLHAAMIHVPLGLLVVGTVIELLAPIFWRRSVFRAAGRWMILLGALSLLPVAAAGAYAMVDVNQGGGSTWSDVRAASPIQGQAWHLMKLHMLLTLSGSAVVLLAVVLWLAASDRTRSALHLVFLVLLLGGVGTLAVGGRRGGTMVYRHHVGMSESSGDSNAASSDDKHTGWRVIEDYVPPVELHVVFAGAAFAAGLAAIGLSMRRKVVFAGPAVMPPAELSDIGYVFNPAGRMPPQSPAAQLNTDDMTGAELVPRRQPVARFWVLALALAITAAVAGYWTLAADMDTWKLGKLIGFVRDNAQSQDYRLKAHLVLGGGMIGLMLLMALIARVAAGRRVLLGLFSLLLLAAMASQGWVGTLLLMDSPGGTLTRFNSASDDTSSTPTDVAPIKMPASATTSASRPTGAPKH